MGFGSIVERYQTFKFDASYKGFYRAFVETFLEQLKKIELKRMGIVHPDLSDNHEETISLSRNKDSHENQPSTFFTLNKGFSKLGLKNADIQLLDIGCGTGRVLTFGMLMKVKHVTGIDLDEEGIKKAISNCTIMQSRGYKTGFDVYSADACCFGIPQGVNVIYLFNPFGEKTMDEVVGNIVKQVQQSGNTIYIIYANPKHLSVFDHHQKAENIFQSHFKSGNPDMAIFRINNE